MVGGLVVGLVFGLVVGSWFGGWLGIDSGSGAAADPAVAGDGSGSDANGLAGADVAVVDPTRTSSPRDGGLCGLPGSGVPGRGWAGGVGGTER